MNTKWTTCDRKLLLNGKTFFVRGINYAPTPIGRPGRLDMLGHEGIFTRDLKNIRRMHANAVKTYDFYTTIDHTKFLDAAYNNGDHSIYTIFSIWIDQTLMTSVVDIDGPEFQLMVRNYYEMAKLTGGHPGVMGYSIGGEMNSIVVVNDQAFWDKFALLTTAVRKGLAENGNAQKIITTTFVDDGGMSFTMGEKYKADVDMWGSNVYQTNYPGSVIPAYKSVPGTKPLLVSEYGFPYASNVAEGTTQELHMVGNYVIQQAVQMEQNYNLTDPLKEQVLVGGFVFEYSDEWWKSGADSIHNYGGVANNGFPMGWLSEEFFGLYRIEKSEEGHGVDNVHPRPTVDLLTQLWAKPKLGGEGEDYSTCNSLSSTVILQQLRQGTTTMQSTGVFGTIVEGLFAVIALCALALLVFAMYDTKSRRARYRRLSQPQETIEFATGVSSYRTPMSPTSSRRYRVAMEDDEDVQEV